MNPMIPFSTKAGITEFDLDFPGEEFCTPVRVSDTIDPTVYPDCDVVITREERIYLTEKCEEICSQPPPNLKVYSAEEMTQEQLWALVPGGKDGRN